MFYELGLAHARGKPAVLLSQTLDDVPFDLRNLRIVIYDRSRPSWGEELRNVISKTLLSTMQAGPDLVLPSFWRRHQVVPPGGLSSIEAEKLRNAYSDTLLRIEGFKQVLRYNKIPYSERMEYQYIREIDAPNYAAAYDDDEKGAG